MVIVAGRSTGSLGDDLLRASNLLTSISPALGLLALITIPGCAGRDGAALKPSPVALLNLCEDARIPKGVSCQSSTLPSFISGNAGTAAVAEVHLGMRIVTDYSVPVDEAFALLPDNTFVRLPVRRDFAALLQINSSLLQHNPVGSARTWLPSYWTLQLDGPPTQPCLTYKVSFPFSGRLSYCANGEVLSDLGYADSAVSLGRALELSAQALLEKGLSVANAEHLENRDPTRITIVRSDRGLEYEIVFDGRRRVPPYKQYVIHIPVTGEKWTITEVPWPSKAF